MRNNETGEFELVVGNKQLLSGFFIVVLLFAVAFAMGYVVGQNTQRPAKLAAEGTGVSAAGNAAAESRPLPASPVTPAATSAPPSTDPAAGQPPATDGQPQPTTQPTAQPQPTTQPATQPAAQPPTQAAPAPAVEKPAATPAGTIAAPELPPGSFWQVMAVKPEMAGAIRLTLKDKGFQVVLTPGTSNLTRVLVGPYGDGPSLGRARTALEAAGFHPARYKRD